MENRKLPFISIVTVTYNCVKDIEATIQNVLSQDYPYFEYIIIDGKSTDGTMDIINSYSDSINCIISEPDKGIYDAMNKGIIKARGQWITFMNAGDCYASSHAISSLLDGIDDFNSYKVIYGNTELIHIDGKHSLYSTAPIYKLAKVINQYQPFAHQAVFYNITQKEDCFYDCRYHIAADYNTTCRYYKKYGPLKFYYKPIVVCIYKAFDGISTNPLYRKKALYEKIMIKCRNQMNIIEIIKDSIRYIKLYLK